MGKTILKNLTWVRLRIFTLLFLLLSRAWKQMLFAHPLHGLSFLGSG